MSAEPQIDPNLDNKLANFEDAFRSDSGGCRRTCECGREFWDSYNSGYTWEDGEVEALQTNPKATALDYSVETIRFEGREYVLDCTCWHARAKVIIGFIDGHARSIAKYLTLEKKRKQAIADAAPEIEA